MKSEGNGSIMLHSSESGIIAAFVCKELLLMAGIDACTYTTILGILSKTIFSTISKTYGYLCHSLWKETLFTKFAYQ